MPRDPNANLKHPLLNPTDEYGDRPSLYNYNSETDEEAKPLQQFKESATPTEFLNLILGRYGHDAHHTDDMARMFEEHPHNNPKNIDIALRKLSAKGEDSRMQAILRHFHASPKQIDKMIDVPEAYGMHTKNEKGHRANKMASLLSGQKHLNADHIRKMLQHDAPFEVDKDLLDAPAGLDPAIRKEIAHAPNAKLTGSALEELADTHDRHAIFDNPDKSIAEMIERNPRSIGAHSLDKLADRMSPEARTKMFDRLLGIEGGKHRDEEYANDPEANWENWEEGEGHNPTLANTIAESKHLQPHQAEHIMRHGDEDQKHQLFHNDKISNKYADQMYAKWLNDDHNHGYDLDDFKDKLKEDNEFDYDDWYEEARQEAEENYPFKDYLADQSDEDLMGTDEESWIDNHLEGAHDWYHTPEATTENPEPEEQDFSGRDKEDHPEYQARRDEAQKAYDDVLARAKSGHWDTLRENLGDRGAERLSDHYSEAVGEGDYEIAQRLYDEHMDKAHENPEFLPSHLSSIQEIKRKQAEEAQKKAAEEAKAKEEAHRVHLDKYIPNRPSEHAYGEGQHHMELAKQYADANGGSIDVGHLNKMYPNMVEKWKKIFNGKGKLSSDELQQKIDALPKSKYNLSYQHWAPDDMQNINGHDEMVIRLDHSPETLEAMKKDPEVYDTFQKINDVSQRSGHPTNYNTIGWARVDFTDPKNPMIDELQSDFSSAARDYLAEHGESGQDKAKALDKIMHIQKSWRENLLNAVTKIAKQHGAEALHTHSPESKAAHTGSSKVHSVYKDSYEKVPRQMGFKPTAMENLPLSEEGKKTFMTAKSGTAVEKLLEDHLEGMDEHAKMWEKHNELAIDPQEVGGIPERDAVEAHKKMAAHHMKSYKAHQQRLEQIDPSHKMRVAKHPSHYIRAIHSMEQYSPLDQNGKKAQALNAMSGVVNNNHEMPVYGFDSALKEQPEQVQGHGGHTLPLSDAAFKKHIVVLDLLRKAQMGDSDKVAVAEALMNIKGQAEQIETLKTSNPEAYAVISELTQVLVDLFKELNNEPIEAVEHQLQVEQQMLPPEEGGQQEVAVKPPPEEKPITHGSKELPIGAIREYSPQNIRQKTPDGKWIGVASGQKRSDFQ